MPYDWQEAEPGLEPRQPGSRIHLHELWFSVSPLVLVSLPRKVVSTVQSKTLTPLALKSGYSVKTNHFLSLLWSVQVHMDAHFRT